MKFKTIAEVALPKIIKWHKDRVDEWNKFDLINDVEMSILLDSIQIWKICKQNENLKGSLADIERLCVESLRSYWGENATMIFNDDLSVKCFAHDGRVKIITN